MMEKKHARGPWKYTNNLGCKDIKGGKRGTGKQAQYSIIAYTTGYYSEEKDLANAKLIAAAPDLLEALLITVKLLKDSGFTSNDDQVAEAEEAIKKATT